MTGTLMAVRILDRSLSRLPAPLRTLVDWALTITLAAVAVLAFEAEVAKPYRIPSASMEPTLHCAKPVDGCKSRFSDSVIANRLVYRFHSPNEATSSSSGRHPRTQAACRAERARSSNGSWGRPGRRSRCRLDRCSLTAPHLPSRTFGLRTGVRESGSWRRSPEQRGLRPGPEPGPGPGGLAPLGRRSPRQHHRAGRTDVLASHSLRENPALVRARGTFPNQSV